MPPRVRMCDTVLSRRLNEITKFKQSESISRRCPLDWLFNCSQIASRLKKR